VRGRKQLLWTVVLAPPRFHRWRLRKE
jgi:hypothetical protein